MSATLYTVLKFMLSLSFLNNLKHQYTMGGLPLDHVTEEKDLGVTVTESLSPVNRVTLLLLKLIEFLESLKKPFHVGTVSCYLSCINP